MSSALETTVGTLALIVVEAKQHRVAAGDAGPEGSKDFASVVKIAEDIRDALVSRVPGTSDESAWSHFRSVAQSFESLAAKYPRTELAAFSQRSTTLIRQVTLDFGVSEAPDGRFIVPLPTLRS